jgi:hypothetical protein
MAAGEPIRVYVTHAWSESDDYLRVFEYLESARHFFYQNCSAPGARPPNSGLEVEHGALHAQITAAEVVIALASLVGTERELLKFQMSCAKGLERPVLLLPAFGTELRMPPDFMGLATQHLNWDERALVDALRKQARHQDTNRWDVVEFKLD